MQKQYVVTLATIGTPQQAVPSWPAGVEAVVRVSTGTNATRFGLSSADAVASPQMNVNVLHELGEMDVSKLWFTHDTVAAKIQVLVDLI